MNQTIIDALIVPGVSARLQGALYQRLDYGQVMDFHGDNLTGIFFHVGAAMVSGKHGNPAL